MYTNPSNIIKSVIKLLEARSESINKLIESYQPDRKLTVIEGIRRTLADGLFPCLEIEATGSSSEWATTRAQRPRYNFNGVLTIKSSNEALVHEYISTLMTMIAEILTSPNNLQLRVLNEKRYDLGSGQLVDAYILDSMVEDVTYNSNKAGTIRTAEFTWFALMHETWDESKWKLPAGAPPIVVYPRVVEG